MIYLASKFKQYGGKTKFSSNLFENVYNNQSEDASNESDWFKLHPKFISIIMRHF